MKHPQQRSRRLPTAGVLAAALVLSLTPGYAQQNTLRLSSSECVSRFINTSNILLAGRLEPGKAEALREQNSSSHNPTFTLDQVNLWAPQQQVAMFGDGLPPLFGSFGRNQQLSIGIEQTISTGGKKSALYGLGTHQKEKSEIENMALQRALALDFRRLLHSLEELQRKIELTQSLYSTVATLKDKIYAHSQSNAVPRSEYNRLQVESLTLKKELSDLEIQRAEKTTTLKSLLNIPEQTELSIDFSYPYDALKNTASLPDDSLFQKAQSLRADLATAALEITVAEKKITYENAQAIPDLTLSAVYDRGGSFMYNFVGFGLSFDIPIFNRNQGNIRFAEIEKEQALLMQREKERVARAEIAALKKAVLEKSSMLAELSQTQENDIRAQLETYARNYERRTITIYEFIDHLYALSRFNTLLVEAETEYKTAADALMHAVGDELLY